LGYWIQRSLFNLAYNGLVYGLLRVLST
jgi:hypothetical protein